MSTEIRYLDAIRMLDPEQLIALDKSEKPQEMLQQMLDRITGGTRKLMAYTQE